MLPLQTVKLTEGSFWETAYDGFKKNTKLRNYHILVDYNKIQSYGPVKEVLGLEPLKDKLKKVLDLKSNRVNGHDTEAIDNDVLKEKNKNRKPKATIWHHTVKGKGFYFAEGNPFWHHKNFFTR